MTNDNSQLDLAREWIASATHPVSFSGAGLSAESGIATFRDKDETGLWSKFDPTELASQAGFTSNPSQVIDWYNWRRQSLAKAQPNAAHLTLARQRNWIHITQNVDNLLERAGASPTSVLHLHGSILTDRCNGSCGYCEEVELADPKPLRHCKKCDDLLRPAVVWFGESLPEDILSAASAAVSRSDLLLVIGTSAQVYPAAGLIPLAREQSALIIVINTDADYVDDPQTLYIQGKAAEMLPALVPSA